MKVRKAIKKMVALGAGLTMVGATIFGAAAADLSEYPSPMFIKDGVFDGIIVVGDSAAASDVIGSVDIATSLQYASTTTVAAGGTTSTVVTGDSAAFSQASDMLELNESIGNVRETFTSSELEALQGGVFSTDQGTTDYNQYIRFNDTSASTNYGAVIYGEDEYDEVGDYLFFDDGAFMFEYEIEFEEGAESDIKTGNDLDDFEDEILNFIGNKLAIVDTDITTASEKINIELMGGQVTDTLEEGETKTYTVDGTEYEVTVLIVCDTCADGEGSAKFRINDETTDELGDGDTDKLGDLQVGIRDIMPNEAEEVTGGDIVEFYLGASKIEFTDNNFTDDRFAGSASVKVGEETIEDANLVISGTMNSANDEFEMNYIKYRLNADAKRGSIFVKPGNGVRAALREPDGMLVSNWDIFYGGLMDTGSTEIKIDSNGDDEYNLLFTSMEGIEYSFQFVDNDATGGFKLGTDDEELIFIEAAGSVSANCNVMQDYMFVLSDAPLDDTSFTHILTFESIDTSEDTVQFSDLGGGEKEMSYTGATPSALGSGELIVGGKTYNVVVNETTPALCIDQNADGDWAADRVTMTTQGGAILNITSATNNVSLLTAFNMTVRTLAKQFDEAATDELLTIEIQNRSSDEVGLKLFGNSFIGGKLWSIEGDEDISKGMTPYGTYVERYDPSGSDEAEEVTITYPLSQVGADVYVTAGVVSASTVGGGAVSITPIQVGAAKLATEVADITAVNAIVIGGPCANAASATLLGDPDPCWEAIPENKAMIKLFENGNKVALLVAGRSALDTRRACRVLANAEEYDLSGKEAAVTGTSLTNIDVSLVQ